MQRIYLKTIVGSRGLIAFCLIELGVHDMNRCNGINETNGYKWTNINGSKRAKTETSHETVGQVV